jgi:hypothetical protein
MGFDEWLETEDGQLAMSALRDHVSMVSREIIETALKATYLAGAQAGRQDAAQLTGLASPR